MHTPNTHHTGCQITKLVEVSKPYSESLCKDISANAQKFARGLKTHRSLSDGKAKQNVGSHQADADDVHRVAGHLTLLVGLHVSDSTTTYSVRNFLLSNRGGHAACFF